MDAWKLDIMVQRARDDLVLTVDALGDMFKRYPQLAFHWESGTGHGYSRAANAQVFSVLDADNDGRVTPVELLRWARMLTLGRQPTDFVEALMAADKTGKGYISETDLYFALVNNTRLSAELDLQCKMLDHSLEPPSWRSPGDGRLAFSEEEEGAKRGISREREKKRGRGASRGRSKGRRKKQPGLFGTLASATANHVTSVRQSFSDLSFSATANRVTSVRQSFSDMSFLSQGGPPAREAQAEAGAGAGGGAEGGGKLNRRLLQRRGSWMALNKAIDEASPETDPEAKDEGEDAGEERGLVFGGGVDDISGSGPTSPGRPPPKDGRQLYDLGTMSERADEDDESASGSDFSDDYDFEEMERGGPRGRSTSMQRKNELRSERDMLVFSAIAKMGLQRVDHEYEVRRKVESTVAADIFRALDETGDGIVEFWELQVPLTPLRERAQRTRMG